MSKYKELTVQIGDVVRDKTYGALWTIVEIKYDGLIKLQCQTLLMWVTPKGLYTGYWHGKLLEVLYGD